VRASPSKDIAVDELIEEVEVSSMLMVLSISNIPIV